MGLLDQAMPQQAAQPQQQQQPKPEDVDRVVLGAAKLIHSPKVSDELIALMKAQGDPVQALVEAVFVVMSKVYEASGNRMPPEVLGAAGVQVIGILGQLAQAARLFKVTPELLHQAAEAAIERLKQQGQSAQSAPSAGVAPSGEAMPAQPMGGM